MTITYFPADWAATTTYASGDRVDYAGTVYEATAAITGDAENDTPFDDQDNWKVLHINAIENIYSLIEAVKLQINVKKNDSINGSIPMAIRLAEQSIATHIRVPQQIVQEELTVDSNNRIAIPNSLVEIENVEIVSNAGDELSQYSHFVNNGRYELIELNRYEYQRLYLYYSDTNPPLYRQPPAVRSAGYWNDGQYLHFAPKLAENTKINVVYKAQLTPLGYPIQLTDADGNFINADGDTLEEWVDDGNSEDDFVIDTGIQEINWYVQAVPRLIYFGTLLQMAQLLNDDKKLAYWEEQFLKAKIEAETLIDKFEDNRPSAMYFESDYPLG